MILVDYIAFWAYKFEDLLAQFTLGSLYSFLSAMSAKFWVHILHLKNSQ